MGLVHLRGAPPRTPLIPLTSGSPCSETACATMAFCVGHCMPAVTNDYSLCPLHLPGRCMHRTSAPYRTAPCRTMPWHGCATTSSQLASADTQPRQIAACAFEPSPPKHSTAIAQHLKRCRALQSRARWLVVSKARPDGIKASQTAVQRTIPLRAHSFKWGVARTCGYDSVLNGAPAPPRDQSYQRRVAVLWRHNPTRRI